MISKKRILTEQKILDAVHEIIKNEGYDALGINKISKVAFVPKPLIYRYFGSFEMLIRTYVSKIDYLTNHLNGKEFVISDQKIELKSQVTRLLIENFNYFFDNNNFQSIILKSISEKSKFMTELSDRREEYNEPILNNLENLFKDDQVDVRAISAILVSATYFLTLHAKRNNSKFCGIDVKTEAGRDRIVSSINSIVSLMFKS